MNGNYFIYHGITYCSMIKKTTLFLFVIFTLPLTASLGQEMSKSELTELIQGLEKNITVLEYQMVFEKLKSPDANMVDFTKSIVSWLNNAVPTGIKKDTYCLTEPGTGRIYFRREGTGLARIAGSSDDEILDMHRELGFDGQARSELSGLPDANKTAIIDEEPLQINKELSSFEMGMDMLLPCYKGMGLSQYLLSDQVEGQSVRGALQKDGTLEVTYKMQKGKKKRRLIIDISKGAILSEEYFMSGSNEIVVVKMEYEWKKNDNGYWVPYQGVGVQGESLPLLFRWTFNEAQINHFKPTPDRYRVAIPPGTHVEDRRVGITYVVGELPRDVVLEVQKNLLQTVELNPDLVDETEDNLISSDKEVSIPQIREKNEDSNDINNITAVTEFSKNSSLSWVFLCVLSVIGLLILLILMLIYVRIKKEKTVCIILLLFLLSFQQESFAGKNDGIQLKYFDGWTSQGCGDKRIQIYQCGLNSGVYVLEYYKKKYDIGQLMDLMTPVLGKGISLSDIIRTLQLYGLEVRAMKGVSADDLCTHLNRNLIALLPTNTSGKKGHYYIVIPGRKCEFILVNAGISVSNCSKKQIQKMLSRNNGIVAFIDLDRDVSDTTKIKLSMVEYDLGMFPLTPQKELIAKFELNNISDEEVLLKDVITSCSCMAVECIGKTVKDKLDANIIVFSDAWGLGKKTKRVIFVFGDGSVKKAEIKGECFDETGLHNLHVSPSELYIELNDGAKNGVISRDVKVFTEEETVHVNSEGIEWLNAKLLEKDKNEFRTIEIEIHADKLKDQETVAYLDIWSKENVPKIKLPIHISTPKQFTIKPRIAKITLGKSEISSTTFMITPLFENDKKISIIDASTEKSELVLNWGDSIEENNKLSVSIKQKQIDFGLHPIDMMVSINNNIYTERVYVLVK